MSKTIEHWANYFSHLWDNGVKPHGAIWAENEGSVMVAYPASEQALRSVGYADAVLRASLMLGMVSSVQADSYGVVFTGAFREFDSEDEMNAHSESLSIDSLKQDPLARSCIYVVGRDASMTLRAIASYRSIGDFGDVNWEMLELDDVEAVPTARQMFDSVSAGSFLSGEDARLGVLSLIHAMDWDLISVDPKT